MQDEPSIRRRDFLTRASVAGTAGLVGMAAVPEEAPAKGRKKKKTGRRFRCLHDARLSHFRDLVGHQFVVYGTTEDDRRRPAVLTLKEAEAHIHPSQANRPAHVRQEPFVLLFVARSGENLESGIYRVEHRRLGRFELFLHETRSDSDPHWRHYEAVFN